MSGTPVDSPPDQALGSDDFHTASVVTWQELQDQLKNFDEEWIFRGQSNYLWSLTSSLDRGSNNDTRLRCAYYIYNAFRRRAHHFLTNLPSADERLEWMALMQHHGAPTRLLDWTKSPYVGLFFALERSEDRQASAALWAVNRGWVKDAAIAKVCRCVTDPAAVFKEKPNFSDRDTFNNVFDGQIDLITPVEPFRTNERLTIQQGAFLAPANLGKSFLENMAGLGSEDELKKYIHKIKVSVENRIEILFRLHRMNINRATLFPGLDEFQVHCEATWR